MSATDSIALAPSTRPVLGNAVALLRDPLRFLTLLPDRGDLVRIGFGPWPVYMVCSPELTHQVLMDDRTFDKGGLIFDRVRETTGNGLTSCPHSDHRRQRRLIQPAFHRARLPRYAEVMSEQITAVTSSWRTDHLIDVLSDMQKVTARTLVTTMFAGSSLTDTNIGEMIDDLNTVMKGMYTRVFMPASLRERRVLGNARYHQARARLRGGIGSIIAERRHSGSDEGDLLSALLAARDSAVPGGGDRGLTDSEVVDQCVTFFMAGTDTTAAVLAWALHLLALSPRVEEQLHAEVDNVVTGDAATFDELDRLTVTGSIITETLRLYPPIWLATRTVTREVRLGRHLLPAGTTIAYSAYLLHRQKSLYPDPDCFAPDRWQRIPSASRPPHGTLVPFSTGARKCIGDDFGVIEATLTLGTVARQWRLRHAPGTRVRPARSAVLTPRGLNMLATPRARMGR
jgi:pentalenene oxygenase